MSTPLHKLQEDYMRDRNISQDKLRVVIVGKTGTGKSSTLNSICGFNRFRASNSAKAITKICETESIVICGKSLTLVDTPGLFDPRRHEEDTKNEIARCIDKTLPGPHVVLFTLPIGRVSEEDKKTLESFIYQFGKAVLKHVIIIYTHCDQWKRASSNDPFETFAQEVKEVIPVLQEYEIPYMRFDNTLTGDDAKCQTRKLLTKISNVLSNNQNACYSNDTYQRRLLEIFNEKQEKEKKEKAEKAAQDRLISWTISGVKFGADLCIPGAGAVIEAGQLVYSIANNDKEGVKEHAVGLGLGLIFFVGGSVVSNLFGKTTKTTVQTLSKQTTKSTVKSITREASSKITKASVETVANNAVQEAGKQAIGKTAVELSQQASKSVLKTTATQIGKDTAKATAKKVTHEMGKQTAKFVTNEVGKATSLSVVNATSKTLLKQSSVGVARKVTQDGSKTIVQTVSKSIVRNSVKQGTATLTRSVVKEAGQKTIETSLKSASVEFSKEVAKTTVKRVTQETVKSETPRILTEVAKVVTIGACRCKDGSQVESDDKMGQTK